MFNIFLTIFFSTLAFACVEPFFFIGYLISIALFGLFQALFMANAGGAWDNAKKIVEVELKIGLPAATAHVLAAIFAAISMFFAWRSFYGMRIGSAAGEKAPGAA